MNLALRIMLSLVLPLASFAQDGKTPYTAKLKEYRYSRYLDSTQFYFAKSLSWAQKRRDSVAIFYTYKYMGDGYEHHQKLDSTLFMYDLCDRYLSKKNFRLKAFLLNDRAYTYQLLGNYNKAAKLTLEALKYAEKSKDNIQVASINLSIADKFALLKLNKQAEEYYERAVEVSKKTDYLPAKEYTYRVYGNYLLKNNRLNAAFGYLQQASKLAKQTKDSISMAFTWSSLADCFWKRKEIDSCFFYAKKAEGIWYRRAEYIDYAHVCGNMGEYYMNLGKYDQAKSYFKKAEKYLRNDLYLNERLYSDLATLYQKTGQLDSAIVYLTKAKKTLEQIKENERKSQVAALNIKYQADRKEVLVKNAQQKSELANLKLREKTLQFNIGLVILLALLLVIAVVIFSYRKIRTKNRQLFESNIRLERSVKQKQVLLQEVHHRVKNNLSTLKSLLFLQARASKDEHVKAILTESQHRIQSMALVHENLYQDLEYDQVKFYDFTRQLFDSLVQTFQVPTAEVRYTIERNEIAVDVSTAIFLGLILNEFATNTFKYAFNNQKEGAIKVGISEIEDQLVVVYSDNGIGLARPFQEQQSGFGFKLIRILVEQVNAELTYKREDNWSIFILKMQKDAANLS